MHGFSRRRDAAGQSYLRYWQLRIGGEGESAGIYHSALGQAPRRVVDFRAEERGLGKKALQDARLVAGKAQSQGSHRSVAWSHVQTSQQTHPKILLI